MYRTVAQYDSLMDFLGRLFPALATRVRLPEVSHQGSAIHALRLRAGSAPGPRRGVLIVGGTHARELMNPDAVFEFGVDLMRSYLNGADISYGGITWAAQDVKVVLEAMDVWLVPCINPDGRGRALGSDRMWRKNLRPHPDPKQVGVDLNRNSDLAWGITTANTWCNPATESYCGPMAFSEPESRNVRHLLATERIVTFVDVHSYSELVLYPWGHAPTQGTDPSRRFTSLATGTCAPIVPANHAEYMPPRDLQRFTTVADRVVDAVKQVRGRVYTAQSARALYAVTGSQADYAYGRHIAVPAAQKTYGFTLETGPRAGTVLDSFQPTNPDPIKLDTKAALMTLLEQSLCAIELIGSDLIGQQRLFATLRQLRDDSLAHTAAGRAWIALVERTQLALLLALKQQPALMGDAARVLEGLGALLEDPEAVFGDALARDARGVLRALKSAVKLKSLRIDLAALDARVATARGQPAAALLGSLVRQAPGAEARRRRQPVASPAPPKRRPRRQSA